MTQAQAPQTEPLDLEEWKPYEIDHLAQQLVANNRDKNKDVLNESHKMRMAVAYGLERFWGERFRLEKDKDGEEKAEYWKAVWETLANILNPVGIVLPQGEIESVNPNPKQNEDEKTKNIKSIANSIWEMPQDDREIALTVLAQFCDSLVWWTQRYKKKS
jgi:hypothetical protein